MTGEKKSETQLPTNLFFEFCTLTTNEHENVRNIIIYAIKMILHS